MGNRFSRTSPLTELIENGAEVESMNHWFQEARFFRAFDYFLLVQTFGGVPLDLGSGELKFNITPSRTSVRNTPCPKCTQGHLPDLLTAIRELAANPSCDGRSDQDRCRLYLAKAYLTYAWWLKNPNNIPTYPESASVRTPTDTMRHGTSSRHTMWRLPLSRTPVLSAFGKASGW